MSFVNRMFAENVNNLCLIKLTLPVISDRFVNYKQGWQHPQK